MKTSNIIATLSGVEEKVIMNDEVFYDTNLIMDGVSYPARIPEYLKDVEGKCEIVCSISTTKKDKKMFTYVNILTAKRLEDQSTPDKNVFTVGGSVQRNGGIIPIPSRGTVSLSLVVSSSSGIEEMTLNTVHLTSTDKIARQLATITLKSTLEVEGYLKSRKGCLYVHITKVLYSKKK